MRAWRDCFWGSSLLSVEPVTKVATLLLVLLLITARSVMAQAPATVSLQPEVGGLLTIRATVAGHDGVFLFDSGSGVSNITPEFAAVVGSHPWGKITGFRMTGQRVDMQRCDGIAFVFAGRSFPAGTVGVLDVSKYLPSGLGHIDGTIALDVFAKQAFTFSYAGHFIRFHDARGLEQRTKTLHAMPLHVVRDAQGLALSVDFPVLTADGTAWFEMDSGNTSSFVLVGKHLAPLFQLSPENKEPQKATVTLADGTCFEQGVRVLDLVLDGNLGTSFLSRYDVTLDLAHQTGWVTPYAPPRRTDH
jgi:hypothetical protein